MGRTQVYLPGFVEMLYKIRNTCQYTNVRGPMRNGGITPLSASRNIVSKVVTVCNKHGIAKTSLECFHGAKLEFVTIELY